MQNKVTAAQSPGRLQFVDEARGLAVLSMIISHFAPGALMRLPQLAGLQEPILLTGRLATVGFVIIFGITIGIVHFPRYVAGGQQRVARDTRKRALLVAFCAVLASLPFYFELALFADARAAVTARQMLFSMYSVLNYYMIAVLSIPLLLWLLQGSPRRNAVLVSLGLWAASMLLILIWPMSNASPGFLEYARLHLISGPYAFLQLTAAVVLAVPLGIALRRRIAEGKGYPAGTLLIQGALIASVGWVLGQWSGEMSVAALIEGRVKTPPRVWYWMLIGGIFVVLFSALVAAHQRWPRLATWTRWFALFGQASLPIYTFHQWILPMINWLDAVVVIEGVGRLALALAMFAVLCASSMWYYSRKLGRRPGVEAGEVRRPRQSVA